MNFIQFENDIIKLLIIVEKPGKLIFFSKIDILKVLIQQTEFQPCQNDQCKFSALEICV